MFFSGLLVRPNFDETQLAAWALGKLYQNFLWRSGTVCWYVSHLLNSHRVLGTVSFLCYTDLCFTLGLFAHSVLSALVTEVFIILTRPRQWWWFGTAAWSCHHSVHAEGLFLIYGGLPLIKAWGWEVWAGDWPVCFKTVVWVDKRFVPVCILQSRIANFLMSSILHGNLQGYFHNNLMHIPQ